jgi:flagellar basal-body rod protein FlgC
MDSRFRGNDKKLKISVKSAAILLAIATSEAQIAAMGDPLSIAVSGLTAASLRLDAAASNIANSQDTAPLSPQPGEPLPYQPVDVVQKHVAGGGTLATFEPVAPASNAIYDPGSPFADANGQVAAPNTDLAQQLVNTNIANASYDANLQVVETAQKMQGYLLNIFA